VLVPAPLGEACAAIGYGWPGGWLLNVFFRGRWIKSPTQNIAVRALLPDLSTTPSFDRGPRDAYF
jgi:hypothetical protein